MGDPRGVDVLGDGVAVLADKIQSDTAMWKGVVDAAKIKVD